MRYTAKQIKETIEKLIVDAPTLTIEETIMRTHTVVVMMQAAEDPTDGNIKEWEEIDRLTPIAFEVMNKHKAELRRPN